MFKPYTDKSSLKKNKSRHLQGGTTDVISEEKLGWWERKKIPKASDDITLTIKKEWEKRPDLIAYEYYGTTELEWLVLQYNNIVDVNEEFLVGMTIIIPSSTRAIYTIPNKAAYPRLR